MDSETTSTPPSALNGDQQAALRGAWDQIVGKGSLEPFDAAKAALEATIRFVEDVKAIDDKRKELGLPAEVLGAFVEVHAKSMKIQNAADIVAPQRAERAVLPMSSGVPILPGQSAQITARPQLMAFRPERLIISDAGVDNVEAVHVAHPQAPWWKRMWPWYKAPQPPQPQLYQSKGAADWVINDIKIGNRSQFSQSGDVPGDMFSSSAVDSFVSFETAQTAMDVVAVVTYIGANPNGQPFYAAMIGTAAI